MARPDPSCAGQPLRGASSNPTQDPSAADAGPLRKRAQAHCAGHRRTGSSHGPTTFGRLDGPQPQGIASPAASP
jgi:hypothetical protein